MKHARLLALALMAALLAGCGPVSYVPDPRALQEAELGARVKSALLNSATVDATGIEVRVAGGMVVLEGDVATEDEGQKAVEIARKVPGVAGVTSKLAISRRPRRTTALS